MDETMKIAVIVLTALSLTACMGREGNPNAQPYADQIAVAPQPAAAVAYDPGVAKYGSDVDIGRPGVNASPVPMPVYQPPPPR
jgi:hypothetical protein